MRLGFLVVTLACATASAAPDTRVELTWVVHQPKPKDEYSRRPLDLEIKTAGTTKTIPLALQLGALYPYNQIVCKTQAYPLETGEVAKITFYEGGAGGYFVRRKNGEYLLVDWSQTDGACPDAKGEPSVCPRHEKLVTKLDIPADAKIVEAIVEVDGTAKRRALWCKR